LWASKGATLDSAQPPSPPLQRPTDSDVRPVSEASASAK
jgi:hypothetical protein